MNLLIKLLSLIQAKMDEQNLMKILNSSPHFQIAADLRIGKYRRLNLSVHDSKILIEEKVVFREFCNILVYPKAHLIIRSNVFFNNYCSINCLEKIEIGENTLFGECVKLYDHDHLYSREPKIKVHSDKFTTAPIYIGKDCWIGSNVTILKDVTIGDNVIIGANNLIRKSVPPNTVVKAKVEYV